MKYIKIPLNVLVVAFVICTTFSAYSQSQISSLRVEFKLNEQAATLIPDVIFTVATSDLAGVDKILITLGSTDNGAEFLSYTINADGTNLPQGVTMQTQGNNIIINTGNHSGIIQYYASAKLQYTGGSYSEVTKVSNAN